MGVNKHLPHIFVLPEDDADREIANGFHLGVGQLRQMQVLQPAGGWMKVLNLFQSEYAPAMHGNPNTLVVLLIDFDEEEERRNQVRAVIPEQLADRVFVLGPWSEPERLAPDLGALETIGSKVADDCRSRIDTTVQHNLLRHNAEELARLRERALPILFPA